MPGWLGGAQGGEGGEVPGWLGGVAQGGEEGDDQDNCQHFVHFMLRDSHPGLDIRAAEVVAALQPGCEEMERE